MRIEVKAINPTTEQKEQGTQPYAADLHLSDRMVRLGVFVQHKGDEGFAAYNLYREGGVTALQSAEDGAHAIAEYQMGRHIANLVPIHLANNVPE